jgi:hypothetical protein
MNKHYSSNNLCLFYSGKNASCLIDILLTISILQVAIIKPKDVKKEKNDKRFVKISKPAFVKAGFEMKSFLSI